jgi:hypothetical protein
MSTCPLPNKELFSVVDEGVSKFMKKFNKMKGGNESDVLTGGAFVIIPIVVGVIINFLSVNNNHFVNNDFRGLSDQMKKHKSGKSLPTDSDYDAGDYKRRDELYKLLTKGKVSDKQLQIYNSFDQPRRDQVDIQRCLYILTTSYFEDKYDKQKYDDTTIKSVIYFLFSNHLYIVALIAFFVKDDDKKKRRQKK